MSSPFEHYLGSDLDARRVLRNRSARSRVASGLWAIRAGADPQEVFPEDYVIDPSTARALLRAQIRFRESNPKLASGTVFLRGRIVGSLVIADDIPGHLFVGVRTQGNFQIVGNVMGSASIFSEIGGSVAVSGEVGLDLAVRGCVAGDVLFSGPVGRVAACDAEVHGSVTVRCRAQKVYVHGAVDGMVYLGVQREAVSLGGDVSERQVIAEV